MKHCSEVCAFLNDPGCSFFAEVFVDLQNRGNVLAGVLAFRREFGEEGANSGAVFYGLGGALGSDYMCQWATRLGTS